MAMVRNGVAKTDEEAAGRTLMELKEQEQYQNHQLNHQNGDGLYLKVMTDEQMELLRRQISVYATICEQLVEMHKSITAQQDLSGISLGNLYCDSLMTYAGNKITARQRWTPTPVQLQILERIFDEGSGTPGKQKIKDISTELSQHGHISETNVYNWFQNRRARSKRKQFVVAPNIEESEVEAEIGSSKDKKMKPESVKVPEHTTPRAEDVYFQDPERSAEMLCLGTQSNKGDSLFPSDQGLISYGSFGHLSAYESVPRIDQLMGKMEIPGTFGPCQDGEYYDIVR